MSFKLTPPVEIYKFQNEYYYSKTKKPCKYNKEQTEELLKMGKYIVRDPQGDHTPILNKPKAVSFEVSSQISNSKLVAAAADKGIKISNKVAMKIKELYPDYKEQDFDIAFNTWSLTYDSISFSQKRKNQLAFHKKKLLIN